MKVNEALAYALAVEAEGPIFGLMGDAYMPVWGSLCKDPRTRMVWARHDGAAVLMADGCSKATGRLGVASREIGRKVEEEAAVLGKVIKDASIASE